MALPKPAVNETPTSFPTYPDLKGKVALITGSSRGIGAATARRLAADGASVVINYFGSADLAHELAQQINTEGIGKAVAIKADMSSTAEGARLVQETIQRFGRLDILVLNMGMTKNTALSDISEKEYDDVFTMNVKVPLFVAKAAAPHLQSGSYLGSRITEPIET